MSSEAGKGDERRPEDSEKFRSNYDLIFRKPVGPEEDKEDNPEKEV